MSSSQKAREVLSEILNVCGGDGEQYEGTIDALEAATQIYIACLTKRACEIMENPRLLRFDDVVSAIEDDPDKVNYLGYINQKINS